MQNPVDHETFSTACHAGLHIGTSSTLSLGPSSFSVKWSETQAWHFPSMRDFRFEWSWALKLLCAVPLTWTMVVKMEILGEILRCHVSWFFVRPTCLAENPVDCETLSTACHAGLHIGISSIQSSSVPQALLQSEVGRSRHFPPMRILDFSGYGPSSSCIKCPLAGQWLSKWKPFERWRTWLVICMQAPLLSRYPAPISVIAYSYLFGTIIMGAASYFLVHDPAAWTLHWNVDLLAVLYNVSQHQHNSKSSRQLSLLILCNFDVFPNLAMN